MRLLLVDEARTSINMKSEKSAWSVSMKPEEGVDGVCYHSSVALL
jgi:hypothetical protein